ncbi:MAG TPA: alpha/beta hydrolase-fold protein [Pirellulales bacterium]|nr:alpha/beta hydrolase-fold protein [Pirellulales bacterium]
MNRLQSTATFEAQPASALAHLSGLAREPHFGSAVYRPAQGETHVALFAPLHYEPNYAYPLLVWLHGPGDDESQLKRIMPLVSVRNYVAAAPRGPRRQDSAAGKAGYRWPQSPAELLEAEHRVFEAIEMAQTRFNISPRRIFVAGFDAGGTMAFRLAMEHPRHFAGVLSLAGAFPTRQAALRRLVDARRVPVFLACGRDSRGYDSLTVCRDLKLFHSAGMDVALRQYPCGQEIAPAMLGDMDRWIMEQVTGASG